MNQKEDDKKVRDNELDCDICGKHAIGFWRDTSVTTCGSQECNTTHQESYDDQ